MRKHIGITFDFDAMSGFIARGLVSPTPFPRRVRRGGDYRGY
jgi:hypothetical protein